MAIDEALETLAQMDPAGIDKLRRSDAGQSPAPHQAFDWFSSAFWIQKAVSAWMTAHPSITFASG